MFIYKITNKVNGKIYIGQVYNKTIYDRFERHCKEASPISRSYVDRAINKYGRENFMVELIDTANTTKELNEKEIYWIKEYNSTDHSIGYNLTDGGDGGNTYKYKTASELADIKSKISKANMGKNNGNSSQLKCLNIETGEVKHFDTLKDLLAFLGTSHKETVRDICTGKSNYYYKDIYNFAFESEKFRPLLIKPKRTHYGAKPCYLINKITGERFNFRTNSIARANSDLGPREKENRTWKIVDVL